ncbi:MAG: hypothetical protein NCW75_13420 [Phycisphaera sp.]|nr:MAG: hypothetical protein NCW75_13420 [Phycisphaera sp.]
MPHREPPVCETLEPRMLLSVNFTIDYTFDANGFFDDPVRREVIEAAADYLGSLLDDSLNAITPGGGNEWSIRFTDPATGMAAEVDDPTIDQDELLLFVGGRDLSGDTLGLGGAGGFQASGSSAFVLNIEGRGQSGATGPEAGQSDTSLWGGSIVFDADTNWHFGTTTSGLAGNEHDFYSVALHEMVHVLGFTDGSPAFANLISPSGEFMGAAAMAVSSDTQLDTDDLAHWREGLASAGQETAMDPTFSRGTRKLLTPLDFAALEDIGWEVNVMRWPGRGASISLSPFTGGGVASGSASPANPGLHWVDVSDAGLLDFRITADQPVTLRLWDSQGLVIDEVSAADTITGLGLSATDQFYTIEVISSSAATYDMAVSSGGFDEVAYYPEGFASVDIDQTVYVSNPTDSAQLFTLTLRYEREGLGRDGDAVVVDRVIEPGTNVAIDLARGGTFATDEATGRQILASEPYAIVLSSTAPLSATLEHADVFGGERITTAEGFTAITSTTWYLPRVEKAAGTSDFLVFYNPNSHDVRVSVLLRSLSGQIRLTQTVRGEARGGLSIGDIGALADGAYGIVLTSEAVLPADQADHDGVVAAVSHYDGTAGVGWTALGSVAAQSASQVVPLADLPGSTTEVLIFNPESSTAVLSFERTTSTGTETLADRFAPPGVATVITVPNGLGYSYSVSGGSAVVQFVQRTSTETTSGSTPTIASRSLGFSLGTFDPADSDSVLRLGIYNTSASNATVTVRFVFLSGAEVQQIVTVDGRGFRSLQIDTLTAVRARIGDGPLAVFLDSSTPITGVLAALDGELGWASGGMLLPA